MKTTLVLVISVITISRSLDIPEECTTGPDMGDFDEDSCCPSAPNLLTDETIQKCDFSNENKTNCEKADCAVKITKYLTSDGKVNTSIFKNMTALVEYPEWRIVFDSLLKNCSLRMDGANVTCKSEEFFTCLMGFGVTSCPPNLWNNTAECTTYKTFMVKCVPYLF